MDLRGHFLTSATLQKLLRRQGKTGFPNRVLVAMRLIGVVLADTLVEQHGKRTKKPSRRSDSCRAMAIESDVPVWACSGRSALGRE